MALLSAQRKTAALADPLPIRFEPFNRNGVVLRRGQFTLLCSAPSVGKSLLARNIAAKNPMRTLYFSADSDEHTVRNNIIGALSGQRLDAVDHNLSGDSAESWREYYSGILHQSDQVEWVFSPNINLDYIDLKLRAYCELYGDFPELTVIDNVGDMVAGEDEEYAELRVICRELRQIGRGLNTHMLGLVHAKGAWEDGQKPITLGALLGNLGKVPESVLGLHWADASQQRVLMTVPKLRGGRRGQIIPLDFNYETGSVAGFYK